MKLKSLRNDILKRHILGRVIGNCYTIEFQKRGLPHAHMLFIIHPDDRLNTPEDVDNAVSAELLSKEDDNYLYTIVKSSMIHDHRSCGYDPAKEPTCIKHFPHSLQEITSYEPDKGYPVYRRRLRLNTKEPRINQSIVPHNRWLLKRYGAHINVEISASVKSIQYIYKYVYKGSDRTGIAVTSHIDEATEYRDARWIGSQEACWRFLQYKMGSCKPSCQRLQVHLPQLQTVTFRENQSVENVLQQPGSRFTTLTEWFTLNQKTSAAEAKGKIINPEDDPRLMLYGNLPERYMWSDYEWKQRRKGESIGRMYFIHPKAGDLFYLRLLLLHVPGAESFEHLRTVNGKLYTWKEACDERGLLADDAEWNECLDEVAFYYSGHGLRDTFALVMVQNTPSNPKRLWEIHKERYVTV